MPKQKVTHVGFVKDGLGGTKSIYNIGGKYHLGYHAGLTKEIPQSQVPKKFLPKLKGQPGAAQGASGKHGGNPCHDNEGKFC